MNIEKEPVNKIFDDKPLHCNRPSVLILYGRTPLVERYLKMSAEIVLTSITKIHVEAILMK